MLKMTGTRLEVISDINMYLFVKKVKRTGISCVAKKWNLMMIKNQINILHILMQKLYLVGQWAVFPL